MIRSLLYVAVIGGCAAQYAIQRNNVADNVPAWYQMAKPSAAPTYGTFDRREPYERLDRPQPQHTNSFSGYPSFGPRSSGGFPEMTGMAPTPQRRYTGGSDQKPFASSIKRYHKLLLSKSTTSAPRTPPTPPPTPVTPRKPKSLGNIYSTITPRGLGGQNRLSWRKLTPNPLVPKTTTSTSTTSTTTSRPTTSTAATTAAARFICNRIIDEVLASTQRTIRPFRPVERTFRPRALQTTTKPTTTTGTTPAPNLLDILWPNSELLNAIKDVVAKFKASLDETGLDEDVRLMGNQLRNTWHQLRTVPGPMNEQLGRLLEKAADATEQKTIRN